MASVLAIVSKKSFEAEHRGAEPGQTLAIDRYESTHKALDTIESGDSLFLVTARPNDRLWLLGELVDPTKDDSGWSGTNQRPLRDISDLIGSIKFASGKGISAKPGRLGMSLQTPRALSAEDVALLRGGEPAPATDAVREQLESILGSRMSAAIPALRALLPTADAATLEAMYDLGWFDIDKWRSNEALLYWVYAYFLAMRFGRAEHLAILENLPRREVYSVAHEQVDDARALVADVIRRRDLDHSGPPPAKLPRARAKLAAYLRERIGDPDFDQVGELVELVRKPRFSVENIEGLAVLAALLLHGDAESLAPLRGLVNESPFAAQLLGAVGLGAGDTSSGDALAATVYANPTDDGARAVYADWLLERDDPRGEFISAQLAGEEPEVKDLVAVTWSGLADALLWQAPFANEKPRFVPRFRRGFLSGCQVDALDGDLADRPEWSTIEVLDVRGDIGALADYDLRSLIAIGCLDEEQLSTVAESPLRDRLIAIGVADIRRDESWKVLEKFPNLKLLALDQSHMDLARQAVFDRLEVIVHRHQTRAEGGSTQNLEVIKVYYYTGWGSCLPHYDRIIALSSSG